MYRFRFNFKEGDLGLQIPDSELMFFVTQLEEEIRQARNYLKLKEQPSSWQYDPNKNIIEQIKFVRNLFGYNLGTAKSFVEEAKARYELGTSEDLYVPGSELPLPGSELPEYNLPKRIL